MSFIKSLQLTDPIINHWTSVYTKEWYEDNLEIFNFLTLLVAFIKITNSVRCFSFILICQ